MFIRSPEEYPILTTHQSNAYVSGMQTDLELYGNELNYFTTFFKLVVGTLFVRHSC